MLGRLLKSLVGGRGRSGVAQASAPPSPPAATAPVAISLLEEAPAPEDLWRRSAPSLDRLTIIVPILPGRGRFLQTLLTHFEAARISCPIIMTVNSDAVSEPEVEREVAAHPALRVRVQYHPMSTHFVDRLTACARAADTPYVFVHSDDDFVLPDALGNCVAFLDQHDDHVACEGRSFFYSVKRGQVVPQAQRFCSRPEHQTVERVLAHCRDYTNTFHAVVRRDAYIISNDSTMARTRQVIFWQYLQSCWLVSRGKLKVLDDLYYMRLNNPQGERATLMRRADRTHWPYLVVAPDFSDELTIFKRGLADALGGSLSEEALADVADECCLGLVRRAFGGQTKFEPAELQLQSRFFVEGSSEAAVARYCGARSRDCIEALAVARSSA